MITTPDESTLQTLVNRLAELEQAHAHLQEELQVVRAERAAAEEQTSGQARTRTSKSSRRKVLEKGLGVAVASVGAGALLELSSGTALAAGGIKPGVFASSVAGTPAVKATGTNMADGVDASSDSGIGVSASSTSGTGVFAQSSSFNAIHAKGGGSGVSALFAEGGTGFGVFATSDDPSGSGDGVRGSSHGSGNGVTGISVGPGGDGVTGIGHPSPSFTSSGGIGVTGPGSTGPGGSGGTGGTGVTGTGGTGGSFGGSGGIGVHGIAGLGGLGGTPGLAGLFDGAVTVNGNVQVNGTLSATTKNFVQDHPTDPTREIVYVSLEGGEAGTYVRGTSQLINGKAVLALPEHFGLVTATEGLTIQLTSRGEWLQLYLVELDTAQIVVREAQGKSGAFDYLIHGVRKGYEQHEVIRTKR